MLLVLSYLLLDNILLVFSYLLMLLFLFSYFEVIIEKDNFLWGIFLEFFVSKIWRTNILNFQVKKTHLWKKKVIFIHKEKNACYNLIIVIVFDQEVVILPMNSHLLWFDWQVKELTDYFSEIRNQIQDNITFQMPKRRKLTGI